jgi:hypothetical protein
MPHAPIPNVPVELTKFYSDERQKWVHVARLTIDEDAGAGNSEEEAIGMLVENLRAFASGPIRLHLSGTEELERGFEIERSGKIVRCETDGTLIEEQGW